MIFKEINSYNEFFNMLPIDWRESVLPYWNSYKNTTQCYVLQENEELIAGGLVFSECPPDMLYFKEEADNWFKNGYLYLGFIYVSEAKRGQNLGSMWLSHIKNINPLQKYWLVIEDLGLHNFYIKNGFKKEKTLNNSGQEEVIYCFEGTK